MCFSKKLVPDEIVRSVFDISPHWLRRRELASVILDLDNTLVPYGQSRVGHEVKEHIQMLLSSGVKAIILSNAGPRRTRAVAAELGMMFVAGARKPGLRGYRTALAALQEPPSKTAAVGDQVFRDVLGARSAGCFAVLVPPMSPRDFPGTALLRYFERLVLGRLVRSGEINPSALAPWFEPPAMRDRT